MKLKILKDDVEIPFENLSPQEQRFVRNCQAFLLALVFSFLVVTASIIYFLLKIISQ